MTSNATKSLYRTVLRNYLSLKFKRTPTEEEIMREATLCGVVTILAGPDDPDYDALARAHEIPQYKIEPDEIDMTYWREQASVNGRYNGKK